MVRELDPRTPVRGDVATCSNGNCARTAVATCQAPLQGKAQGAVCGRALCLDCRKAGGGRCGPHARHPEVTR
jgi:hypothetical protein